MAPKCSPSAGHHSIASASSGGKHPPGLAANSSHIISDGAHLTDEIALTLVECREILEEATAKEEQAQTQEQINGTKDKEAADQRDGETFERSTKTRR